MGEKKKETMPRKKIEKVSALIAEHKIVKGSFIVAAGVLKVVAFAENGDKIEKNIRLDKPSVSITLT